MIPNPLLSYLSGTDIYNQAPFLWEAAITTMSAHGPPGNHMVELGTRAGHSALLLSRVAQATGSYLVTCDPEDYEVAMPLTVYLKITGEDLFRVWQRPVPFFFVDTDPHSYDQTIGWLDTWIEKWLIPGGCAAFHDAEPEGEVHKAVTGWVRSRSGWVWKEIEGLGLLYR